MTKPVIAAYTMYLGIRILQNAFKKKNGNGGVKKKKINIPVLGLIGGFIDSFGGGAGDHWLPVLLLKTEGRRVMLSAVPP